MQRVTVLAAALLMTLASNVFAAETAPTAKADPAKGKTIVEKVCASCHGIDGNAAAATYPNLAGQHAEYLVKQLTEFKKQVRKNPIMLGMASTLSDTDMRNVAAYFAAQQPKEGGASAKTLVDAGQKIFRGGIAAKGLPACMACHGPSGAGIPVQFPRVAGQHADYIEAQLKAFRSGERANNEPMQQIAAKMSDHDIKAVAQYMQALQ